MSNLAIMGKVRRSIHICENICVIPVYGNSCRYDYPPNHISDVYFKYNGFYSYTMISVVESNGVVVKPPDVFPSNGMFVPRPSLGLKYTQPRNS